MGGFGRSVFGVLVLGLLLLGQATSRADSPAPAVVSRCVLDGTVDAGSSAFLVDCVRRAQEAGHQALLIRLDTPGGELESTRNIVRAFLGARIPVLVWVGPSGARAGSAGVFITLASHLAAMAPGTNIGAAHPVVGLSGQDPEEAGGKEMARKIENDAVAFVEAIAKQRGRNVEWAISAVRNSESVPAEKALALHVIEHVAPTQESFLEWANGRSVTVGDTPVTLRTANAQVVDLRPSFSQRFLHALAQPAVVYILFLIAGLGIAIELTHPGLFAPGVVGVVCLVLALLASSALPVRTGAIVLLLLGVALLVAELFVTSGLLGTAGLGLLVLGGVFLVDRFDPGWFLDSPLQVPLRTMLPTAVFVAGAAVYLAFRAAETRRKPQLAGDAGLVGEMGQVLDTVSPSGGEVFVHGERWAALSSSPLPAGTRVVVRRVEGLTLFVDEVKS
ncbi:NfeD family protein [Archangium lansingense]|uniref:Nodulation protein NfeD n=1 Tax=Archangium lansingense TaxID=2995310 RepID=A0ABT3ZXC9_9BACT|nr:NfeD family protein [Archangium lansinium]MCY1073961.1 nodulation protein NfeD [Archangium lansinium]